MLMVSSWKLLFYATVFPFGLNERYEFLNESVSCYAGWEMKQKNLYCVDKDQIATVKRLQGWRSKCLRFVRVNSCSGKELMLEFVSLLVWIFMFCTWLDRQKPFWEGFRHYVMALSEWKRNHLYCTILDMLLASLAMAWKYIQKGVCVGK